MVWGRFFIYFYSFLSARCLPVEALSPTDPDYECSLDFPARTRHAGAAGTRERRRKRADEEEEEEEEELEQW
jgi:hypothetical protein